MMTPGWVLLPFEYPSAPVVAIALEPGRVWAGGPGGVARFSDSEGWRPPGSMIALRCVTALACGNGCVLAGHESGIARSVDDGKSWARPTLAAASRRHPPLSSRRGLPGTECFGRDSWQRGAADGRCWSELALVQLRSRRA